MDTCHYNRQKKYREHLGIDTGLNIFLVHAKLFHNLEAPAVLIAFSNLLIIYDKHRGKHKYYSKENRKEQESAPNIV